MTVGAGIPAPGIHGAPGIPRGARGQDSASRYGGTSTTGAGGGVTFSSREISSEVGEAQSSRGVGDASGSRRKELPPSPGADEISREMSPTPGGASDSASRCFSCRKSRVSESLIRKPPSPRNSADGSTTDGPPGGGSSSAAGGRSSFSSGPRSRVNAPRSSSGRTSGPAGLTGASASAGAGISASVSPMDGEGASAPAERTRSKARSTSSFPGSVAFSAREKGLRSFGLHRPGRSREGDQVPDRGRESGDSRRRNPAPRSRGRRNRPRPAAGEGERCP